MVINLNYKLKKMSMFNTSLSDYWKLFFLKIIANFASQLYKHRCVLENN